MTLYHKNTETIPEKASGNHRRRPGASAGRPGRLFFSKLLPILLLILLLPVSSVAKNLPCNNLPLLMKSFLANHYAMKNMTGDIKAHAVDQMIKRLDPSKTLLYASDVERLKPVLQTLFTGRQADDCASLTPVYDLLVARARENETIVKKILDRNYRIDETVEMDTDVKKRPYVKTVAEKHALLKKMVQFQIENALLSSTDLEEAKKQQIHRYALQTKRIVERDPEKLITSAAEAFALALDPHTNYLSSENLEDIRIQMQLSLEGIGALLRSDNGFTIVEELIPGGGAERSGLIKPNDKIIAVAQENEKPVNVIDMELRDIVKMIRGKKGTQVTLTILRQAERTYRFNVTLMRDKIDIKDQEAKITYETRMKNGKPYRFGIIDLPSFYGDEKGDKSCYEDVKNLLEDARRQHADGIVLDLSRNGGGLLGESVRLAGLFIGEGGVVATRDRSDQTRIYVNGSAAPETKGQKRKVIAFPAEDPGAVYTGPLVVLTSRMSASASEIVAGALKDYHRAVIIGADHTFGKGSVQILTTLPGNLGGMKITTALYFLPGGKSTQKTGVEADVRLPFFFTLEDVGETALEYPLPAQAITPFLDLKGNPLWKTVERPMIANLAARSQNRIAQDAKFAEIIRNNKEAAGKKGVIRFSDLRKEAEKEGGIKKNETPTELKQKTKEQYAPYVDESVNVLADMVMMEPAQSASRPLHTADGNM